MNPDDLMFESRGISAFSMVTCYKIGKQLIYTWEIKGDPKTKTKIAEMLIDADEETVEKTITKIVHEHCNRDLEIIKKLQGY